MSDLVKRLRIKAGMIEMGELIAWGSDSALMREAADALEAAVPAVQGELVAWATRLYNTAYHAGHHDTVEGGYTHVYPQDMDSYHEDVVQEWLADNPPPAEQQPLKSSLALDAAKHLTDWLEMGLCERGGVHSCERYREAQRLAERLVRAMQ